MNREEKKRRIEFCCSVRFSSNENMSLICDWIGLKFFEYILDQLIFVLNGEIGFGVRNDDILVNEENLCLVKFLYHFCATLLIFQVVLS